MIRARYTAAIAEALIAWDGKPARWGIDDCGLALADIDLAVRGFDTAEAFRGKYDSEEGARALLGRSGLAGGWARIARRRRWPRIPINSLSAALDGDRAIARTAMGPTSVIRYRGHWVGRFDRGNILVTDAQIVKAWKVC